MGIKLVKRFDSTNEELTKRARELAEKHDLDISKENLQVQLNNRLKRTIGRANISREIIEISKQLFEKRPKKIKEDVLLHELIHLHLGHGGHGLEFSNKCIEIGRPEISDASLDLELEGEVYNYILKCENCGKTLGRYKKSKAIKNPEKYSCSHCDGDLKRIK
jgi:predicted SprT family Zn-dependent metalloprotease